MLSLIKYFQQLSIYSFLVFLTGAALFVTVLKPYFSIDYIYIFFFFVSLTAAIHYFLVKASQQRIAKFTTNFMLATTIKLMLYLFFILIYVFTHRQRAVPFLFFFLSLYFLFTVFEVVALLKLLKKK